MVAVIKVGGSLAETPSALKALGSELCRLAKKKQFIVVPGGGPFADAVRDLDSKFALAPVIAHKMAILAMDQYGLLLSQVIPDSLTCESVSAAKKISKSGQVAILLPSIMMNENDPFEPSWDVTSDSIAAQIAVLAKGNPVIFVTNVDGIFTKNPKHFPEAELLSDISVNELMSFGFRTSVDKFLPYLLLRNKLDCYVVSGFYPERVTAVLSGQKTTATYILPKE